MVHVQPGCQPRIGAITPESSVKKFRNGQSYMVLMYRIALSYDGERVGPLWISIGLMDKSEGPCQGVGTTSRVYVGAGSYATHIATQGNSRKVCCECAPCSSPKGTIPSQREISSGQMLRNILKAGKLCDCSNICQPRA